jgi:hypothetical protein
LFEDVPVWFEGFVAMNRGPVGTVVHHTNNSRIAVEDRRRRKKYLLIPVLGKMIDEPEEGKDTPGVCAGTGRGSWAGAIGRGNVITIRGEEDPAKTCCVVRVPVLGDGNEAVTGGSVEGVDNFENLRKVLGSKPNML